MRLKSGDILSDFEWQRCEEGYRWHKARHGLKLVPAQADGEALRMVTYRPFSKQFSGMFKRFVELDPTPDAALAFANDHGHLGYPLTMVVVPKSGLFPVQPPELTDADWPDPLMPPTSEFYALRERTLSARTWKGQVESMKVAVYDTKKQPWHRQSMFNDELGQTVRAFMSYSFAEGSWELHWKPISLAGVLWLQAAQSLSRLKSYRACVFCKRLIEISRHGGARTDAEYCSNSCRTREYRRRKKEARSLHDRGHSIAEIADRVGSEPRVIRRWLLLN
jgi:hypothetical protein